MRTRFITAALAACALLATIASAQAQERDLLNTLEVKQLVSSGGPADHARLHDHFVALAQEYDADARRLEDGSGAFVGNPNRRWTPRPGAHAERLAESARASAATARSLAEYHERLAAGLPAALPRDAARFHGGEGAPEPTERHLRALAANARTPVDHRTLEEYFLAAAADHRETAEKHAAMARNYRVTTNHRTANWAAMHCDWAAEQARKAEREALADALVHRQLANVG